MRVLPIVLAAASLLAACGNQGDGPDSVDTPASEGLTAEEVAARVTTAQASMTPAEREEFRRNMVTMLDQAGEGRAEGYKPASGVTDQIVAMQPLQTHTFDVNVSSGTEYLVFAVCDGDCTVVDLTLQDAAGNVIQTDTDSGDFPVMDFTPSSSGRFTLKMKMTACTVAPCYAGARVYEKV